ncbi:MAG: secondary thiamine-phosphate synthase enzyme YjbQ [Dehalococcoidia bacterium]|nr:secondary thiamine-phosphate synthase enzyme YjbQ [Dehalococcoidia bacterium]
MLSHISVFTRSKEVLEEITHRVNDVIHRSGVEEGVCYLYLPHTTAGITVNENADPSVARDILDRLETLVPSRGNYHHLEGNAPAHIKSSLMGLSLAVPIEKGRLALGRWQGVFLCEFDGPRDRTVMMQVLPSHIARPGEPFEGGDGQP